MPYGSTSGKALYNDDKIVIHTLRNVVKIDLQLMDNWIKKNFQFRISQIIILIYILNIGAFLGLVIIHGSQQ